MKRVNSGVLSVVSAILIAASFAIPANIAAPSAVSADTGIMKWDIVSTPGSVPGKYDILNKHVPDGANTGKGSEILDMCAGNDGPSYNAVVRDWGTSSYTNRLLHSSTYGKSWTDRTPGNVFQVKVSPDDPSCIVTTAESFTGSGPKRIFVSSDAGLNWGLNFDGVGLEDNETIRSLDISPDYGGKRDLAFVTVGGSSGGRWCTKSYPGTDPWVVQLNANSVPANTLGTATNSGIEYIALKFHPAYSGDPSVALVYATYTDGLDPANGSIIDAALSAQVAQAKR